MGSGDNYADTGGSWHRIVEPAFERSASAFVGHRGTVARKATATVTSPARHPLAPQPVAGEASREDKCSFALIGLAALQVLLGEAAILMCTIPVLSRPEPKLSDQTAWNTSTSLAIGVHCDNSRGGRPSPVKIAGALIVSAGVETADPCAAFAAALHLGTFRDESRPCALSCRDGVVHRHLAVDSEAGGMARYMVSAAIRDLIDFRVAYVDASLMFPVDSNGLENLCRNRNSTLPRPALLLCGDAVRQRFDEFCSLFLHGLENMPKGSPGEKFAPGISSQLAVMARELVGALRACNSEREALLANLTEALCAAVSRHNHRMRAYWQTRDVYSIAVPALLWANPVASLAIPMLFALLRERSSPFSSAAHDTDRLSRA